MASYNKVLLMGNLTRDPEVRYTPKGTAIGNLGLAVNRVYTTEGGEQTPAAPSSFRTFPDWTAKELDQEIREMMPFEIMVEPWRVLERNLNNTP